MKLTSLAIGCLALALCGLAAPAQENSPTMKQKAHRIALAVHGGAGTIERSKMTAEREQEYRAGIEHALRAGREILDRGGSSLDAVEASVRVLEDDPHFNAGKGSVFTSAGTHEMDAAIMDGKTLSAGAVARLEHVRNPIVLARAVMGKSKHVMLVGSGAEEFAKGNGIELVDAKYFFTQHRWEELQKAKAAEKSARKAVKSSLSPRRSLTEPSARWRGIRKGTWPPQLRLAGQPINFRVGWVIRPSLAPALMRTTRPARSPARATANFLLGQWSRTRFLR